VKCRKKVRFNNKEEVEDYIRYRVDNPKGLEAYKCNLHSCWHMGHPKNYDNNPVARVNILLDELKD